MKKLHRFKMTMGCALSLGVLGWYGSGGLLPHNSVLAAEGVHWSYEGEHGPTHWDGACSMGKEQSPIDINGGKGADLPNVVFDYKPSAINLINNGHTVQFNYDEGSSIQLDGDTYQLLQFHFHSPSEHTINGKHFPLEVHLVHQNAKGNLAVVGVLYEEGTPGTDPRAEYMLGKAPAQKDGTLKATAKFDAAGLLPDDKMSFRYNGSLTTPPCSEGVRWIVMKSQTKITPEGLINLKKALPTPSNRPVQALNARTLQEDTSP